MCEENEECSVETSEIGEFVAKCHKNIEKRDVKSKSSDRTEMKSF